MLVHGRHYAADDGRALCDVGDEHVAVAHTQDSHDGADQHLRFHVGHEGFIVVVQGVSECQVELFPASKIDELHSHIALCANVGLELTGLTICITLHTVVGVFSELSWPQVSNCTDVAVVGVIADPTFAGTLGTFLAVEEVTFKTFKANSIQAG